LGHFCGPPLDALQQLHVSPVLRTPHLGTVLQMRPHQCKAEGQDHPLILLATLPLMQHRTWLALGLQGHISDSRPACHPPAPAGLFQQGFA